MFVEDPPQEEPVPLMGDPVTEVIREEGLEEMAGRHLLQPVGGFPLRIARAGVRGRAAL